MKKVTFLYYRSWAYDILKYLSKLESERKDFFISDVVCPHGLEDDLSFLSANTSIHYVDPKNPDDLIKVVQESETKLLFCYSWSWFIPEKLVDQCICLCLHPSKLPKYRGGSPIQNQVFDGQFDSAVSVIKMSAEIDAGPIYKQLPMTLHGTIENIFSSMSALGKVITKDLISDYVGNNLIFYEQNHNEATILKRRKPENSEFIFDELEKMSFIDLEISVNVLNDPYPNFTVITANQKVKFKQVHYFVKIPQDRECIVLDKNINIDLKKNPYLDTFLKVKDGFALISQPEYVPIKGEPSS